MFCACISIVICVVVLICGTTVSIIDISKYDFGLYYALLAIVGLTAAIAVCVVRPKRGCCTRDPKWYTKCCDSLNKCLIAQQHRVAVARANYRDAETFSGGGDGDRSGVSNLSRQQRATLVMLRPAVELMQHMLHGLVNQEDVRVDSKDDEDTSDALDDSADGSKRARSKSKKKKKKKKLLLPTNEACLYTILETSTADMTSQFPPTEATSIVTVHESYSQFLNDSVPNSPAALLPVARLPLRKHLLMNQIAATDSPRLKGLESNSVFNFQRHDVLSEPVDEERFSETRCSSSHEP